MGKLKEEYKQMLLKMTPDDITAEFIFTYLADTSEKKDGKLVEIPSKIKTYDTFELKKGEYFNKETITTNVGLFIFNKFLIEEAFIDVVGYVNEPVTASVQKSIESKISNALLNDVVEVKDMVTYLDKTQWISKQFNSVFANSFTMKSIKPLPKVMERKKELLEENKEALERGDIATGARIESELVELAKKELEGDPGMNLYNSGSRSSFKNNYKNIAITKGNVYDPINDKWDFVSSSFMEGIQKDEIPVVANGIPAGAYPSAVGTQKSGYLGKQLTAAYQGVVLDTIDSDCKTINTISLVFDKSLKSQLLYRYIVDKGRLVVLDPENMDKYVGTKINLRSPMYCIGDKLCSKCAGLMFYKIGVKNVGLTSSRVASTLLNAGLKAKHDTTAQMIKVDINSITL